MTSIVLTVIESGGTDAFFMTSRTSCHFSMGMQNVLSAFCRGLALAPIGMQATITPVAFSSAMALPVLAPSASSCSTTSKLLSATAVLQVLGAHKSHTAWRQECWPRPSAAVSSSPQTKRNREAALENEAGFRGSIAQPTWRLI